jgi:lipopolysaccharide export system permease protein
MTLVSLTSVIWVTQALRDIDIVTNQKQAVIVFIGLTLLLIPALVVIIAPLALVVATAYSLNKLNTDSEIVVMNAAGLSPWRIFYPFLLVALIASGLVAVLSAYLAPKALRELRAVFAKVRADVVTNILQPGRFMEMEGGKLTFHVRERRSTGELFGIFIDDRRDANERGTFLAERGQVVENEIGSFLILRNGSAQRLQPAKSADPTIVVFDQYAFDLSQFTQSESGGWLSAPERYIWELAWPDPNDPLVKNTPRRVFTEFHDRLLAPLFPLAFCIITFAILGAPRTSRQSRSASMVLAVSSIIAVRLTCFAILVFSARTPQLAYATYGVIAATCVIGLIMISRGTIVEAPTSLVTFFGNLTARFRAKSAEASA